MDRIADANQDWEASRLHVVITATRVAIPVDDLARAVLRALQPGNGRSNRCRVEGELPDRLRQDEVDFLPEDLGTAIQRLEDAGAVVKVQKQLRRCILRSTASAGSMRLTCWQRMLQC
jgi:hypothetical protein